MGNYKFRFSDMILNSWFHTLKNMSKTGNKNKGKKKHQTSTTTPAAEAEATMKSKSNKSQQQLSQQRKSYYLSRELNSSILKPSNTYFPHDPTRKSSKKRYSNARRNIASNRVFTSSSSSSNSASCSCHANTLESISMNPNSKMEDNNLNSSSSFSSDSSYHGFAPDTFDGMVSRSASFYNNFKKGIITSVEKKEEKLDSFSKLHLPPIKTNSAPRNEPSKQRKNRAMDDVMKLAKEDKPIRKCSVKSPGLKLRTNSPRIASRKFQTLGQKSLSLSWNSASKRTITESFVVVKSSKNPQKDFKESMMEMIIENNIRTSKDLEELLACYLQLNSSEYHDLIIKVFKQIWSDITETLTK